MSRSKTRTADKRYYGVAEALVSNVEDPEKLGRVKVTFPWFDEAMESDWCRVAHLYAGGGYGSFWIPEVGDEVLVAFSHGDMRFPYVLGGLYNGVDKPPSHRDQTKDQKLFRTKGGHSLLFDDSSGEERVKLETSKGHTADFSDADQKIEIKTKGGHTILLDDGSREVKISSSGGQSVTMDASGGLTVKGVSNVKVDAPQISLGASAASSLVLGEALLASFNTHTHNCTAPGTPSGPPIPPLTPAVLSATNKTS
jgi:uncharacterized protein involved in type VI secretion and phage assembly